MAFWVEVAGPMDPDTGGYDIDHFRQVTADDITNDLVERAANEIWPLENLSSDEARDELREDTRRALVAALTATRGETDA